MKTVRVRIAVAVSETGDWSASGWRTKEGDPAGEEAMDMALDGVGGFHEWRYWVEADMPIPEDTAINGTVAEDGGEG